MPDRITFKAVPLAQLNNEELAGMNRIFQAVYRENSPGFGDGSFLRDKIDYRALRGQSRTDPSHQLGHVFLAKKNKKPVGFLLALDDVNFLGGKPADFLFDIQEHIHEDLDFIRSLAYLKNFAFVLHIAVLPGFDGKKIGKSLVDFMEHFYSHPRKPCGMDSKRKVILVASTIHQEQYRIFKLLRKSREEYQFLDQQFSENADDDIRFRVAHILDKTEFFRRINEKTLGNTFDIVIPIQLNLASWDVNNLICREPLEARILWTSFFTDNLQLLKLSGMRKSYHGYYQPLQDASSYQQFQKLTHTLLELARYLRDKDNQKPGTPSLTPNIARHGFEFFFINDDADKFEFYSFANPLVYSLFDSQGPEHWLAREEFRLERCEMASAERRAWWEVFRKLVKHRLGWQPEKAEENAWEWAAWKRKLGVGQNKEQQLIDAQKRFNRKEGTLEDKNLFKELASQRIISNERLFAWEEWLNLHRKMYEADFLALPDREDYWWCHAVIPITFSGGVSGVMFTFRCRKVKGQEKAKTLLNDLAVTISSSLSKNMLNIIGKLQQHVIHMAMDRYAMAAISARNLSHNMGSHVLSHLGQEEVLSRLLFTSSGLDKTGLAELAELHTYLRIRMSLLADMATNDPVASVPTYLNQEILQGFKQQKLLLAYLTDRDAGASLPSIVFENLTGENGRRNADLLIQLPNGELGRSAFYMLLVNILRNCIKHGPPLPDNKLRLYVRAENPGRGRRGYLLTIYDGAARPLAEVEKMAAKFQKEYIEGDLMKEYEIRNAGLGFAEMLVAARYLRKRTFGSSWGMSERRIEFLEIVPVPVLPRQEAGEMPAAHLGFRIYVKKPRLLLLVGSAQQLETDEQSVNRLNDLGVKVRNLNQLHDPHREIHSHAIAVSLDGRLKEIADYPRLYPVRWVQPRNEDEQANLCQMLNGSNREGFFHWAWEHWICKLRERTGAAPTIPQVYYRNQRAAFAPSSRHGIVFDSHAHGFEDGVFTDPSKCQFYEPFGSLSPTQLPIGNWQKAQQPDQLDLREQRLRYELEEAALTRVVVIDERIQRICQDLRAPYNLPGNYFQFLSWLNIKVPNPEKKGEPNLNSPMLNIHDGRGLTDYLYPKVNGGAEFVVIHLGLVEQIIGEINPDAVAQWLKKLISAPENAAELVLISGRGKTLRLPDWVRFQPYNNIAKYILDKPAKYHLCRMLYGSRTRV